MKARKVIRTIVSTKNISVSAIQWAAKKGFEVQVIEVLGIRILPFTLPEALPQHLIFSSQNAVLAFAEQLKPHFSYHCVGEKIKHSLEQLGCQVTTCEPHMEALLSTLPNRASSGFLYIRGKEVSQEIRPFFNFLQEIVVYESILLYPPAMDLGAIHAILFFSPRGAASFLKNNSPIPPQCLIGAIGHTTAEALKKNWLIANPIVATEPSAEILLQEVIGK